MWGRCCQSLAVTPSLSLLMLCGRCAYKPIYLCLTGLWLIHSMHKGGDNSALYTLGSRDLKDTLKTQTKPNQTKGWLNCHSLHGLCSIFNFLSSPPALYYVWTKILTYQMERLCFPCALCQSSQVLSIKAGPPKFLLSMRWPEKEGSPRLTALASEYFMLSGLIFSKAFNLLRHELGPSRERGRKQGKLKCKRWPGEVFG